MVILPLYSRSDLLFSAAKSPKINVWRSDTGERIGTYNGHNGAVWSVDVDCTPISLARCASLLNATLSRTYSLSLSLSLSLSRDDSMDGALQSRPSASSRALLI